MTTDTAQPMMSHKPDELADNFQISELSSLLAPFIDAELFTDTELQLVDLLGSLVNETQPLPLCLLGLAIRAPRIGHVCVDLLDLTDVERRCFNEVIGEAPDSDGVDLVDRLTTALNSSPLLNATEPSAAIAVLDETLFYLQRMWKEEINVFQQLRAAMTQQDREIDAREAAALDEFFEPLPGNEVDYQRRGAERALTSRLTLISGGPGTGKTRTVARTLCVLLKSHADTNKNLVVRLAAPTGKAASRLAEAIQAEVENTGLEESLTQQLFALEPVTIHRLLGVNHDGSFQRNADTPIVADVIVVDESSMVSLSTMNSLIDAIAPTTRLILVGDPYQLASVDAGAVFGDIVRGITSTANADQNSALVVLQRTHRFSQDSVTAKLATAVVAGETRDALEVLDQFGSSPDSEVRWLPNEGHISVGGIEQTTVGLEALDHASTVIEAARNQQPDEALALLASFKILCGTRHGERGMYQWNHAIEAGLRDRYHDLIRGQWYVGRPVIMTRNDYQLNLFNGEVGVTVETDDGVKVVFQDGESLRFVDPILLTDVESQWAMTIHKSQGSEYGHAVVVLPEPPSPILTRELLYTGLTRAKPRVTIAATVTSIQLSIDTPVRRASGLTRRFVSDVK